MALETYEGREFNLRVPEEGVSFAHTSLKIELATLMGEVEELIKQGKKKEALMSLIAARVKLVDSEMEPELKERVDNELNKLREKINRM